MLMSALILYFFFWTRSTNSFRHVHLARCWRTGAVSLPLSCDWRAPFSVASGEKVIPLQSALCWSVLSRNADAVIDYRCCRGIMLISASGVMLVSTLFFSSRAHLPVSQALYCNERLLVLHQGEKVIRLHFVLLSIVAMWCWYFVRHSLVFGSLLFKHQMPPD